MPTVSRNVRFQGQPGSHLLRPSSSEFDPEPISTLAPAWHRQVCAAGEWASRCCVRAAILIRSVILTQERRSSWQRTLPTAAAVAYGGGGGGGGLAQTSLGGYPFAGQLHHPLCRGRLGAQ